MPTIAVIALFAVLLAGMLLFRMIFEAVRSTVREEIVELKRLPASFDGTRIFFVSDIHRRVISPRLVTQLQGTGIDLVLIGGDLREHGVPLSRSRDNVRALSTIGPVYMVFGNHDYDDDARELEVMLREEGVRVLANESVMLEQRDGSQLRLAGVDDPKSARDHVGMALAPPIDAPASVKQPATILLAHDPSIAGRIGQIDGIDLILSGHTHGGQIVLPILGPLYRSKTTRRYLHGWFMVAGRETTGRVSTRLFVSRGYGTSHIPLRLNAPAESHLFILRTASEPRSQQDL